MFKKLFTMSSSMVAVGLIAGVCALSANGQMQVQGQSGGQNGNDDMASQLREMQQRSQELQTKLNKIVQQAEAENPDLVEKQQKLEELFREKLDAYGYPTEEEMAELRQMQQQLQSSGDMEEEERQQLMSAFESEVTKIQEAQQKARQDEEVVEILEEVQSERIEAMNKIEENAESMMQELQRLHQQMGQLQQSQTQGQ